jgi:hypothetical protein
METNFHSKLYLLTQGARATVITGSSNLTKEGLTSGGELNVVLSLHKASSPIVRLAQVFENEWTDRAVPLNSEQIEKYERAHIAVSKRAAQASVPLRQILGAKPVHRRVADSQTARQYWRYWLSRYVTKRTDLIVRDVTNWDQKHFEWFVSKRHSCRRGDRILLFDLIIKRLLTVEVKELTEVSTPEGRYCVAFKRIRSVPTRILTKNLWQRLKAAGLLKTKSSAFSRRKMSQPTWDAFMAFLRAK